MKKFVKENWFKIGILVLFLILIFTIYSIFKPTQNTTPLNKNIVSESKYLELSKQCKTDGQKNFEEDVDDATREKYKADVSNCYYLTPIYLFNKELNTCLYYGGYSCELKKVSTEGFMKGLPTKRWSKHITDVYTNKSISDVYVEDSSDVQDWTSKMIDDFNKEYERLGF